MTSPEGPTTLTEEDWIVRVGLLQEAEARGMTDWSHTSNARVFNCSLSAKHDRHEATKLVDYEGQIVPLVNPAGFSADGDPINPGPWMIQVAELYLGIDSEIPEGFRAFRGRILPRTTKYITVDEEKRSVNEFYIVNGKLQAMADGEISEITLPDVLGSLHKHLWGTHAE